MSEPMIRKAAEILEFLSQDEKARYEYEAREKALMDEASMMNGAKREGKVEVAQNMLKEGLDVALIAKVTGLSIEKLETMKQDNEK